jgi:hypothetical protein
MLPIDRAFFDVSEFSSPHRGVAFYPAAWDR